MIHKYTQNGIYIVLDIHSGAVHVVDKIIYDLLDYLTPPLSETIPQQALTALEEEYPSDLLKESYSEIYALYQDGLLFTLDEHFTVRTDIDSPIKAMCLHIAHDCNLRCDYCFASTGDFGGGRMKMPFEVGKAAIDFLLEKSANRRNLEVDFFGGEPLMNFEVVKQIVEYARSREKEFGKNFRFTITTNGVLLDEPKMEYINREMSNVVLSLDGRKEVNDRVRHRVDRTGSYDQIVPHFQKFVQMREGDYYVRGTFTKYNLDFCEDVLHLASLGFDQISVEPVVADPGEPYAITEEDVPRIQEEYEKLATVLWERKKAGKAFNFFHFMIDLEQGPCAIKRLRGCGAGNEYVAITPDGDIYPCHQFVGDAQFCMGSVLTGELNKELKHTFATANVYNKKDCPECWARFYCSGGCNANNHKYAKDIFTPHKVSCELERKRVECAIFLKVMERLQEE